MQMEERPYPDGREDEEMLLESDLWTADLGAYEWDMRSDHVRWLNGWCEYHDIDPCLGERHGERWRALMHPEDRPRARHDFDEHVAGRRARYETEYRIRTLTGEWRWIRSRAYVLKSPAGGSEERMIGSCVDINERKIAEIALGRTQRKLEALAAAAPIWMVLTDARGVIEFVNRPIDCLAPGVVTGRSVAGLFSEPSEAARIEEFRRGLLEGEGPQMHTMMLEDGRVFATWAQPVIEAGQIIGIASATADVSERQNRERELLEAVNREQRRFGRDLHDGLGQELTGIALLVRSLLNRAGRDAPALAAGLEEVLSHVGTAIATTRTVAHGVSPVAHEQGGLAHALMDMARRWQGTPGVSIECRAGNCVGREIEPMLADNFYRIAQEALTNAVKHSGATRIVIELRHSPRQLLLTVTDNGCGIPPAATRGAGLGLQIMRGRAELAGAQMSLEPKRGGGTRLECRHGTRRAPAHWTPTRRSQ